MNSEIKGFCLSPVEPSNVRYDFVAEEAKIEKTRVMVP